MGVKPGRQPGWLRSCALSMRPPTERSRNLIFSANTEREVATGWHHNTEVDAGGDPVIGPATRLVPAAHVRAESLAVEDESLPRRASLAWSPRDQAKGCP